MTGEAREPRHLHQPKFLLDCEDFMLAKCKTCGHYLIVTVRDARQVFRLASKVEEVLIRALLCGVSIRATTSFHNREITVTGVSGVSV